MSKYIIFRTDKASAVGWEHRKMSHTGALTGILAEYFDSSDSPPPHVGDRPREFGRFEEADPEDFGGSTHSRPGDWVVTQVDSFVQESKETKYTTVIICYCKYDPIEPNWRPLARGKPVAELLALGDAQD